jgi:hypothetical protein
MFRGIALLTMMVLLTGCIVHQFAKNPSELRSEKLAGDVQTVKIKAPINIVMDRMAEKASQCMHYRITFSGSGHVNTYVPVITRKSKTEMTMVINYRRKVKSVLGDSDESGVGLVADVTSLSSNLTKVTVYTWSGLDIDDIFMDAVLSSAKGEEGECPADY